MNQRAGVGDVSGKTPCAPATCRHVGPPLHMKLIEFASELNGAMLTHRASQAVTSACATAAHTSSSHEAVSSPGGRHATRCARLTAADCSPAAVASCGMARRPTASAAWRGEGSRAPPSVSLSIHLLNSAAGKRWGWGMAFSGGSSHSRQAGQQAAGAHIHEQNCLERSAPSMRA